MIRYLGPKLHKYEYLFKDNIDEDHLNFDRYNYFKNISKTLDNDDDKNDEHEDEDEDEDKVYFSYHNI